MISEMGGEGLTGLGVRFRAAHLVEQASYTLELAAQDGRALDGLLPAGYVSEVRRIVNSILGAMAFPDVVAGEAREVAQASSKELRAARSWRRKIARRAVRARTIGREVPDVLTRVSDVDTAAAVAAQLSAMLAWVETDPDLLPGDDIGALIKEGKKLVAQLGNGKVSEQAARLAALPATDQKFSEEKGLLFVGLRVINDAAQELHLRDRKAAERFNLDILRRRIATDRA